MPPEVPAHPHRRRRDLRRRPLQVHPAAQGPVRRDDLRGRLRRHRHRGQRAELHGGRGPHLLSADQGRAGRGPQDRPRQDQGAGEYLRLRRRAVGAGGDRRPHLSLELHAAQRRRRLGRPSRRLPQAAPPQGRQAGPYPGLPGAGIGGAVDLPSLGRRRVDPDPGSGTGRCRLDRRREHAPPRHEREPAPGLLHPGGGERHRALHPAPVRAAERRPEDQSHPRLERSPQGVQADPPGHRRGLHPRQAARHRHHQGNAGGQELHHLR